MVMDSNEAGRRYEEGIQRIGISNYREAARADTVTGAAEVLEDAKSQNLDASSFREAYENRY
jgi:hypothetical protein